MEAPISFLPTSKYDKYSTGYSVTTGPSWSNRIMIKPKGNYSIK